MKATLGAQFTEKEGANVIKRAYNPALPESENIKKIMAVQKELREIARAKKMAVDYYEANNFSLEGYKGPRPEQLASRLTGLNVSAADIGAPSSGAPAPAPAKKNPFR
jgi:hypothetical protein